MNRSPQPEYKMWEVFVNNMPLMGKTGSWEEPVFLNYYEEKCL